MDTNEINEIINIGGPPSVSSSYIYTQICTYIYQWTDDRRQNADWRILEAPEAQTFVTVLFSGL